MLWSLHDALLVFAVRERILCLVRWVRDEAELGPPRPASRVLAVRGRWHTGSVCDRLMMACRRLTLCAWTAQNLRAGVCRHHRRLNFRTGPGRAVRRPSDSNRPGGEPSLPPWTLRGSLWQPRQCLSRTGVRSNAVA